jgi:hypothetical protein
LGRRKSHGGVSDNEWIQIRRIIVIIIPPSSIITHLLTRLVAPYLPAIDTVMIAGQRAGIVLCGQVGIMTGVACVDVIGCVTKPPPSLQKACNVCQVMGGALV